MEDEVGGALKTYNVFRVIPKEELHAASLPPPLPWPWLRDTVQLCPFPECGPRGVRRAVSMVQAITVPPVPTDLLPTVQRAQEGGHMDRANGPSPCHHVHGSI